MLAHARREAEQRGIHHIEFLTAVQSGENIMAAVRRDNFDVRFIGEAFGHQQAVDGVIVHDKHASFWHSGWVTSSL